MAENKKVLVIGGGFSGLTAAVETAEAGFEVIIVEKNPYLWRKSYADQQVLPEALPAELRP